LRLLEPAGALEIHFRDLARNLTALAGEVKSVVVTSPEPGAGRTSVCVGLGVALARDGRRAAIVDCNLGRPRLHRIFGEPNFVGLTSALEGGLPLERCGFRAGEEGLLAVPTGPVMPGSSALIESRELVQAVEGLKESREVVLLDAPVAEQVLRSEVFCTGFDGVLLVVHAARTPKTLARRVTDELLQAGANLFGAVLNGGDPGVR
jgi:capsular exopolysaccharide synthesis family protein